MRFVTMLLQIRILLKIYKNEESVFYCSFNLFNCFLLFERELLETY